MPGLICYFLFNFLVSIRIIHVHSHLHSVTRTLRYLEGTVDRGLLFPSSSSLHIKSFCDSNWVGCPDTGCSVTGYCVFLGDYLISWTSKKQATVSHSSAEAEDWPMVSASCEITWLLSPLQDMFFSHPQPYLIFCDKPSAFYVVQNMVYHP